MLEIMFYEWRRAIARKKVIALIAVSLFFEIGVYLALYLVPSKTVRVILIPLYPYMWVVGVLLPQSLLLHFLAISIASGSMSEEYEQGTVDFFLTKPVTRTRFFSEKWLGSFTLLALIYFIMVIMALAFSYSMFGAQYDVGLLPIVVSLVLFSSLVFFNISFSIGEMLRRSSLSFIISSSILIGSLLISDVLVIIGRFTHISEYVGIGEALPSFGATQLPFLYLANTPYSFLVNALDIYPLHSGSILSAILSVLAYSLIPLGLSYFLFINRDVPKRVA
ncbi:ABC transporter permease [Sulfolobaceae archaeon RB850M]